MLVCVFAFMYGVTVPRKCLILFNWLPPLTSILAQHASDPYASASKKGKRKPLIHTFLHAPPPVLLEFVNGLADDAVTFSRLGLIGKKAGERAGRLADWCWFASTTDSEKKGGIIVSSRFALIRCCEGYDCVCHCY